VFEKLWSETNGCNTREGHCIWVSVIQIVQIMYGSWLESAVRCMPKAHFAQARGLLICSINERSCVHSSKFWHDAECTAVKVAPARLLMRLESVGQCGFHKCMSVYSRCIAVYDVLGLGCMYVSGKGLASRSQLTAYVVISEVNT
jgi:hypothetical protein